MKHDKKENKMVTQRVTHKGEDYWSCSICGNFFSGYGNNPDPVTSGEDDECCNDCNYSKVLPARIELLKQEQTA